MSPRTRDFFDLGPPPEPIVVRRDALHPRAPNPHAPSRADPNPHALSLAPTATLAGRRGAEAGAAVWGAPRSPARALLRVLSRRVLSRRV